MADHPFQTIADIGLTELQRRLQAYRGSNASPTSDDASHGGVMAWFQDGVHFDLSFQPLSHLGRKILTALLSDALKEQAMPPFRLRMVLALPNHVSVQMVEELMAGFDRIALAEDVIISHTDVTASHSHLGIAASMSFRRDETAMRPDQGPHAGDLICVSGDLGGAFAGLRILLREKRAWLQHDPSGHAPFQPDLSDYAEVVGRQLSPVPRTDVIRDLRRAKIHPGAIWIVKNGLYNDLQQLAEHLGVGAEIHASAIPIALTTRDVADELQEDVDRYALLGGEDYELLFTVKEVEAEQLLQEVDDVAVIGRVLEAEQGVVVHTQE